jgi:iron(III) transport system ATP-binding protein
MKAGRIIETGDPKKIYFGAESRFVADFIGRANLVPVSAWEQSPAGTIVECGLGKIICKKTDFPAGSEVTLCIRPEFIHPEKSAGAAAGTRSISGKANAVHGKIETLVFIGDAYEAEIRSGGILLLARLDPETELALGDEVCFEANPNQCLLVSK